MALDAEVATHCDLDLFATGDCSLDVEVLARLEVELVAGGQVAVAVALAVALAFSLAFAGGQVEAEPCALGPQVEADADA